MKIVILDGYTANPGDYSWKELNSFGEVEIYDRTSRDKQGGIEGRNACTTTPTQIYWNLGHGL